MEEAEERMGSDEEEREVEEGSDAQSEDQEVEEGFDAQNEEPDGAEGSEAQGEAVEEADQEEPRASSPPPESPLLVPSEKKEPANEPEDAKKNPSVSVNADMILEALEALDRKHLQGVSVDHILDFLLLKYPVNRDKTALRTELWACLEETRQMGLIKLNQNGSYRLSTYLEEANATEGDPPGSPSAPPGSGSGRSHRSRPSPSPSPVPQSPRGAKRRRPSLVRSRSSSEASSQERRDPTWRPPPTSVPKPRKRQGRASKSKTSKPVRRSSRLRIRAARRASRPSSRSGSRSRTTSRPRSRARRPTPKPPRRRRPALKRRRH